MLQKSVSRFQLKYLPTVKHLFVLHILFLSLGFDK